MGGKELLLLFHLQLHSLAGGSVDSLHLRWPVLRNPDQTPEVIMEVIKEVILAVIKEVILAVIKEVIKGYHGG